MSTQLRAADADREAVAASLRHAHAEGRLDESELEERLGRCYAARTVAELDRLVEDLPHPHPREPGTRRPRRLALAPLALLVLGVALVAASHGHAFFLVPLLFFVLLRFGRRHPRWR